jgi:hypothetical protein
MSEKRGKMVDRKRLQQPIRITVKQVNITLPFSNDGENVLRVAKRKSGT